MNKENLRPRLAITQEPVQIGQGLRDVLDFLEESSVTAEIPFSQTPEGVTRTAAELATAQLAEYNMTVGASTISRGPHAEDIKVALAKYNYSQDPVDKAELERLQNLK